jgi:hypothetical protein
MPSAQPKAILIIDEILDGRRGCSRRRDDGSATLLKRC